ncbi:MAG: TolC family protein [Saprospiraceae bacterium]|nr:MAG: TolC family protein [Saprospiraceae bacterium]
MKNTVLAAFLLSGFWFLSILSISAQPPITLQDCYRLAASNSAISQNPQLLETLTKLRLQNIAASRLPSIEWKGKATWQNEIFGLPFKFPGADFNIPLYSIQTNLEASYLLYDGGLAGARKKAEQAKLATDKQSVAVELNKLKEQVNQVFFGALLLQESVASLALTRKDLEAKAAQLEAGVRHGAVLESDLKKVQVEQLKIESKIAGLQSDRRAMLAVLGSLTGQELPEDAALKAPDFDVLRPSGETRRPELALFDLQKQQTLAAEDLIAANWNPKAGVFTQSGVGYPDPLNFFDEKVSPYFIAGVQFSWKFWDWKQADRERQQLAVQSQLIENQKKTFEQNIGHQEGKFREDIAKIQAQIAADGEIAKLQTEILQQLSSQLEHGVITATDYLLQSDAELQARLSMETHRVQLAQVQTAYWTWKGWW